MVIPSYVTPAMSHANSKVSPRCNHGSFSIVDCLELQAVTSNAMPSLEDEVNGAPLADSFCRSVSGRSDRSVMFSDCIEVREFSLESEKSPRTPSDDMCSPVGNKDEDEDEIEKHEQQVIVQLGLRCEGVERRRITKSVTTNVGLGSFTMDSLRMQQSGLWRRRRLDNDSTMV